MLHKALSAAGVLAAATLFARLAGAGRTWLPSPIALAGPVLLALAADRAIASRAASGESAATWWRALVSRHRFWIGLASLMTLALVVRLPHISGDLWHAFIDIDEHRLAENVRQFFVTGQIGHETVEHYPGVVFWMVAASSLMAYVWALMHGTIRSLADMPVEMFTLAGRVMDACIGAGTVCFAGLMGVELAGESTGLLAAGLLAIVPLAVDTTTLLRNDPGQTLFLTAAVYAALVAYRSDRRGSAFIAGALAGIATGIKYTSVFVLIPVLVAVLFSASSSSQRVGRAALAFAGFVVALAVSNHFVWSDFPNFLTQLSDQVAVWGPAQWSAEQDPALFRRYLLTEYGPGSLMLLLSIGYGAYSLGTGLGKAWVFWSFPLAYGWLTMQRPTLFPRWVYPFVPFACIAGAAGLGSVVKGLRAWNGWDRYHLPAFSQTGALVLVVAIALAQPLWGGTVAFSQRLRTPTHEIVEGWIGQHAAGGTVLAEADVLDLRGLAVHAHRVPSLRAALHSGLYALCVNDWVVVPEPDKGTPDLKRLLFVARFDAGQGFRGTTGLDYEIYATPKLPPSVNGDDVRLDDSRAAALLGSEWRTDGSGAAGLALPAAGASLFLPPIPRDDTRIEMTLAGTESGSKSPAVLLKGGGAAIALSVVGSDKDGMRLSGVVRLPAPDKVTELRVEPADQRSRIRVVRFRFD